MASSTPKLNLYKKNPDTDGSDTFNIDTMLNDNWDKIDAKFHETTGHAHTGVAGDGSQIGTTGLAPKAVTQAKIGDKAVGTGQIADNAIGSGQLGSGAATDTVIGNRTISDSSAPSGDTAAPTTLFGWLAYMVKSITGGATWRSAPGMTIAAIKAILDAATNLATGSTFVKRDGSGRAQFADPSDTADAATKGWVDNKLDTTVGPLTATLTHGANLLTTTVPGALDVTVRGLTLTNIAVGGNCEDTSKWQAAGASLSTDTDSFVYGAKSIKITYSESGGVMYNDFPITSGKDYIAVAEIKNGNLSTGAALSIGLGGSGSSSSVSGTSGFTTVFVKFTASDVTARVHIVGNGSSGQFAYVDGIRLYGISAEDKAATHTAAQVAERWPYVDGMQGVRCPVVSKVGKNMLGPQPDATNSEAIITEPYKLTLNASAGYHDSRFVVDVLPGVTYTISFEAVTGGDARWFIRCSDASDNTTYEYVGSASAIQHTFTSPVGTSRIRLFMDSTAAGTFTFNNWQLELGSAATGFAARNDDYLYGVTDANGDPIVMHGNDTVYDTLDMTNKRLYRRWHEMVLDGSLAWTYLDTFTGYKRIYVENMPEALLNQYPLVVKDNGMMLVDGSPISGNDWSTADATAIGGTGTLYITISDADATGYDLTDAGDISDYFTAHPYKLVYQRTETSVEVVSVPGGLSAHTGGNVLTVGEGVIYREPVTPAIITAAAPTYRINNGYLDSGHVTGPTTNSLDNKAHRIIAIYRDGDLDLGWIIYSGTDSGYAYGTAWADIPAADYNPDATYTVTYEPMDKYAMTANVAHVEVSYVDNIGSSVSRLNRDVADLKQSDSVQDWRLLLAEAYEDNLRVDVDEVADDLGDLTELDTTDKSSLVAAVNELFTSASNGKSSIAAAITGMGQTASGSDSYAALASKIADISDDADAAVGNVLTGKTFYQGGAKKTGTMTNNGAATLTPSGTGTVAIPAGYHNGSGTVSQVSVPASNVLTGTTIASVAGTMPNNGAVSQTLATQNASYTVPAGYHNGSGTVQAVITNLSAGNIKSGVTVGGVAGSSVEATGDASAGDVLTGKTFSKAGTAGISGSMPNQGAVTQSLTSQSASYTIPAGYHNGSGSVTANITNLSAGNIKSGVTVGGVAGSYKGHLYQPADVVSPATYTDYTFTIPQLFDVILIETELLTGNGRSFPGLNSSGGGSPIYYTYTSGYPGSTTSGYALTVRLEEAPGAWLRVKCFTSVWYT